MSTYLTFNQLRIIHPQLRPKSRTSVVEPSQNFLSIVVRARSKEQAICRKDPHKLWLKRATIRLLSSTKPSKMSLSHILILPCGHSKCSYKLRRRNISYLILHCHARAIHFLHFLSKFYIKSNSCETYKIRQLSGSLKVHCIKVHVELKQDHRNIIEGSISEEPITEEPISSHDRSRLDISETNGVDSETFRKRGLTHLLFAKKPEAPEVENHLGTVESPLESRVLGGDYVQSWFRRTQRTHVSVPGTFAAVGFDLRFRRTCRESTTGRAEVRLRLEFIVEWRSSRCFDFLIVVVIGKSRVRVSSWVPRCSYLHVVEPGSVVLAMHRYLNIVYNKL
ncbi:neurotrimin-like isoform X2 [Vespula squamosa]|uniref:Neurotrimin-like isoform X2 n=1 Tax=Vespula squamosa TaxID=30214 RepID=A0ABD1ZUA2_VESSQ